MAQKESERKGGEMEEYFEENSFPLKGNAWMLANEDRPRCMALGLS